VLRHKLAVLRRQTKPPRLDPADRAVLAALSGVLPRPCWSCFFVRPRRYCAGTAGLVASAWTYPHHRPGRPPVNQKLQQLIVGLVRGESSLGVTGASRARCSAWCSDLRDGDPFYPAPSPAGPDAERNAHDLAGVLAPASRRVLACDLLHRRHHLGAAAVGAVLPRVGHQVGSPCQGDRHPDRAGHPVCPQPAAHTCW
jgi:hypothetical protein